MNIIEKGNSALPSMMSIIAPLVRREFEEGRITDSDYASVYFSLMQEAMNIAYGAGVQEKQIELDDEELKMKQYQLKTLMPAQLRDIEADIALKGSQKAQIEKSVIDNRKIKSLDSLGQTIGMALGANIKVPQNLYAGYFGLINSLNDTSYTAP